MLIRLIFAFAVLSVASPAMAHKARHARAVLVLQARGGWAGNRGARGDSRASLVPVLKSAPTFVEVHSARVENDIILFQPTLIGINPIVHARVPELIAHTPVKKKSSFFTPAKTADDLEVRRERDRLLLFREPQPQGASVGLGLAMFGATTIMSAHLPRPIRVIFDGPVHLGPAVFDGGGMGAGIAGRGL